MSVTPEQICNAALWGEIQSAAEDWLADPKNIPHSMTGAFHAGVAYAAALRAEPREPAGWQYSDMLEGRIYKSKNFGTVIYVGLDTFHGEKSFRFDCGLLGFRYCRADDRKTGMSLDEFLAPKPSSPPPSIGVDIKEVKRVLKPFADEADAYDPDTGDGDDTCWAVPVYFRIRDLRAVRALLSKLEGGGNG